ncbi:Two-component system sensor histidine kinase [Olavius algarvensis associated proteobacterium Delta 3]|nr:Two-component system sensor histidine kinase [Olavius algarvensis associated proteobacterium Delta 3]
MLETGTILFISFLYIGLLFAIAYYGDRRADVGRSIISNPYIYALSLAVYCTAWTFYGSVGRAASSGLGFLPVYIGPTLAAASGWLILRKIIRISKVHRITSIADFIASRYGKSATLAAVVTIIAVFGIVPYISLQLKAISISFLLIQEYPTIAMPPQGTDLPIFQDTAFYVAMLLALFALLFGTRHLDATERHEGLVAAIAFESLVKLIAFLAVGAFVTYGIYNGMADLVGQVDAHPELRADLTLGSQPGAFSNWGISILLSMLAVLFLPRQFQLAVVENVDEEHLKKAIWLFPLYLLAINIFVLPIAFGGVLHFPGGEVDADTFVLTLPMANHQQALALLVFIGGMSAATGMVIVETVAMSTMICNDLVMPTLLRLPLLTLTRVPDLSTLLLAIRRAGIILVLMLGYAYYHFIGEHYTLVSIGLISFTAVAQFGPPIIGGIFWKAGTRAGALCGLIAGFILWGYCLVLPSLSEAGFLPSSLITQGPFGIELLRPYQLFGLQDFDHVPHAVFWSLLFNTGLYIGVSLLSRASAIEHNQAALFVDVFQRPDAPGNSTIWRGTASVPDIRSMLQRFLGRERADRALAMYSSQYQSDWESAPTADPALVSYAEKLLAGAIGSASARVMVASIEKEEPLGIAEVMEILDEARQVIAYSRKLETITTELKAANERLQELDRLKDQFISTVTHELRTPLTSIRSIAEILHDTPELNSDRHAEFTAIVIKESERLTRLIGQVLDFQKMESGRMQWQLAATDLRDVLRDAVDATRQLVQEQPITLRLTLPDQVPPIQGDRDRLVQVIVNLISNAVKFCRPEEGLIDITLKEIDAHLQVDVTDNGIGIRDEDQKKIFEEFRQLKTDAGGRPRGTGLGLPITKRIIEFHGGRIWVSSRRGEGSTFSFILPKEWKGADA